MSNKPGFEASMRGLRYDNTDLSAIDDLIFEYIYEQEYGVGEDRLTTVAGMPNDLRRQIYEYCSVANPKPTLNDIREFIWQKEFTGNG